MYRKTLRKSEILCSYDDIILAMCGARHHQYRTAQSCRVYRLEIIMFKSNPGPSLWLHHMSFLAGPLFFICTCQDLMYSFTAVAN